MESTRLFVHRSHDTGPSSSEELDAVIDGSKPMMFIGVEREHYLGTRPDREFCELTERAAAASLVIVQLPSVSRGGFLDVDCLIVRREEAWRIPAYVMFHDTQRWAWSERTEAFQSLLLGYSKDQVVDWIAADRERSAAPQSITYYCGLLDAQIAVMRSFGMTCFPPDLVPDLEFFICPPYRKLDRGYAMSLSGVHVARVAVQSMMHLDDLGGFPDPPGRAIRFTREQAPTLNLALRSHIQLITKDGWE